MKTFWNTYKSSILLLAAMVAGGVIGFFCIAVLYR